MTFARLVRKATVLVLRIPPLQRILLKLPAAEKLLPAWDRLHPFDRAHGVATSGFVPPRKVSSDPALNGLIHPYAASQSSIIRRALRALDPVDEYTLIDLGCGKGRALLVASEFRFRKIIGVELSAGLAEVARRNAAVFESRFPNRPSITVKTVNALEYEFPPGKIVVFCYHSFGRPIWAGVLASLERALAAGRIAHAYVVYYNPVFSELLDRSHAFKRWFAADLNYAPEELGFGPDRSDTVVIWQSQSGALLSPHPERERKVRILDPEWKAGLFE